MVLTKDTIQSEEHELMDMKEFDFHIDNTIRQFKLEKAEEIADISIDGEIPVKNIIKRMKHKL